MDVKDKLFKLGGDVKAGAEKLAKGAIDGSKKVAEKVKIKNTISQAESSMNAVYIEIGKKFEEVFGEQSENEFSDLLAQLAEARAQIAQAKIELAALDSASICEGCGKYVQEGQRFCPNCGMKQPDPPVEVPAEEIPEAVEETAEEALNEEKPAAEEE